jgi:hypothetical protein
MSHSLCVMGMYDEVKMTVPMVVRYVHCYVFLTYYCAHNGLPLGPSSLLRHTSPSRTDYDSYTSF